MELKVIQICINVYNKRKIVIPITIIMMMIINNNNIIIVMESFH